MILSATLAEIAAGLGLESRTVQKRAKKNAWQHTGEVTQGGGRKYNVTEIPLSRRERGKVMAYLLLSGRHVLADSLPLPPPLDAPCESAELPLDQEDRECLWDYAATKTEENRKGAARRLEAVQSVEFLMATGLKKVEACQEVARQAGVNWQTVYGWLNKSGSVDRSDRLAVLVDNRGGNKPLSEIRPEAWDYFKADYLRRDRPTFQSCYERLRRAAKANGWRIPSLKTLKRRIEREIPHALIVLLRDGEDAYKKTHPAQVRDHSVFHALEAVNGDGYTFFKYVLFESGEVCRPTVWPWQDIYSGKLLAWRLDVSENKDMIRLSIGDLIDTYGIPEHFWFDNTRAAANKDVTGGVKNRYRFKVSGDEPMGLIPQLGAAVHWATPGAGQSKPVERAFGIGGIGDYVDKHPSFNGRGTMANPIPVAEFEAVLAAEIAAYNARQGRRSKVCNGSSFDEVFAASYSKSTIRKATREQRALWLLSPETVTANKQDGSIRIMGNVYWCEALSRHRGQKLVARFDPAHMHGNVLVYTLDGRRIGEAQCRLAAGFNDRNAARDVAKEKARIRKNLRAIEKSELRINARQAAEFLPKEEVPAPPPSTKIVQGLFGRGEKCADDDLAEDYNFEETAFLLMEAHKKAQI